MIRSEILFLFLLLCCKSFGSFGQITSIETKQTQHRPQNYLLNSKKFLNKTEIAFDPEKDTRFCLFTRENGGLSGNYELLELNKPESIYHSTFDSSRPTRITIHGWLRILEVYFHALHITVKNTYLKRGDFNFIAVDWTKGSLNEYSIAASYVEDVGYVVAQFIDFLYDVTYIDFSEIYIIGHSFGAHAAGFAGKYLTNGRLGVIYGLDPAIHLFHTNDNEKRLSYTDADYVEVIHTNVFIFGILKPIGDADFYANNAIWQPGCTPAFCSHLRVISLFSESLIPENRFLSARCDSYLEIIYNSKCTINGETALMGGEPARTNRRGVYYFPTNSTSPFAIGKLDLSNNMEIT